MVILKNSLAVLLGAIMGSVVNMGLIILGANLIPPPAGVDVNDMTALKAAMPLFETKHFIFPFLAHAFGTLVGAFVALVIAASRAKLFAWLVGGLFLMGGVVNALILPAPLWFIGVDLFVAYLPMAWLAILLGRLFLAK